MKLSEDSIRQEIKYKVFFMDVPRLYDWLYRHSFFQESYIPRMVNSLYFDTPNYDFASSNMSGESKRIKVRARWYGELDKKFLDSFLSNSQIFTFEIKRKINSVSDKLNIGEVTYENSENYLSRVNSIQKSLESLVKNQPTLSAFNLLSTIFTNYEREYYELKSDKNIRLTIDKNISYCNSKTPSDLLMLAKDYVIVELKFNPKSRKKVNTLMKNFPFRQVRSSKFLSTLAQIQRVSY
ncbi:VTC domain-containing protein [Gammaproteobacteria bacterium]|jgi:SPX domain protein involved in polyphosphate accumulation|nr:VTC domain-containing protein [Gammaproteobacteria bacterium]